MTETTEKEAQAHRKRVIEKIKKLMKLADDTSNPFENEINAALGKVRELMAQWSIEHSEVKPSSDESCRPEIIEDAAHTYRGKFWVGDKWLCMAVGKLTDTKVYFRHNYPKGESIMYIGTVPDVAIACELYNYLTFAVRAAARKVYGKGWNMQTHERYRNGICRAILDRAMQPPPVTDTFSQHDGQCYALVVTRKKTDIADWMKEKGLILGVRKARATKHTTPDGHFQAGYRKGQTFDIGTKNRVGS